MDTIFISDLRIETRIGIYAREQQVAQTVQRSMYQVNSYPRKRADRGSFSSGY